MKKITLISVAFTGLLVCLANCNKEAMTVNVNLGEFSFIDSAKLNDQYATYYSLVKGTDVEAILKAADVGSAELARISEVKLNDLILEAADGGLISDWDFGDVYLVRDLTDRDAIKVVAGTVTDKTKATVAFDNNFAELKSYLDLKDFYVRTKMYRSKTAPMNVRKLKGNLKLRIVIAPPS